MISVTLNADTPDQLLSDLRHIFPALVAGTPLPPMQEQPKRDEPALAEPPKERKPRAKKEEAKADAGEPAGANSSSATEATSTATDIPDIELVRAKLKTLGATDGFGHDKVFEVLGKYKATNASSVPTERRAELIAEIDELLKGAK